MAYPVVSFPPRHSRINVDNESAAFYAGTWGSALPVIGKCEFADPGNSAATGIFTIHWDELPMK
jgi:hypothetical protein